MVRAAVKFPEMLFVQTHSQHHGHFERLDGGAPQLELRCGESVVVGTVGQV
jgi:hypothetical protein